MCYGLVLKIYGDNNDWGSAHRERGREQERMSKRGKTLLGRV